MKNQYFSILILIFSIFSSCKDRTSKNVETYKDTIVDKVQNKITKPTQQLITFDDGVEMNIEGNIHIEKKIDSIQIEKKMFEAVYQYCGKSPLNKRLFEVLKNTNEKEFKDINTISTAHSLVTKNNDTIYISGFAKNKCMEKNEMKKIAVKIYRIYADKTQANIMIIEDFM